MSSDDLTGRTAVVTGATGGMGRAIVAALAGAGAHVVATDLRDDGADDLLAAVADSSGSVVFVSGDVANAEHMADVVERAVSLHGSLDCAVNAAAIEFETVPLAECTVDDFDRMMSVNVRGTFLSMKAEIAAMLDAGTGSIVNIASTNSFRPQHDQPAYTASKHAVLGLTRSAAMDYAAHGIRVNAICPGAIDTPMLRSAMERRGRNADDVAGRLSRLGRFGQPSEIADAALWLCSDSSSFTTGHALSVDGGMLSS
ncbi:SDR family NAD(P)-dependent oxidoreductase [Ilumatobacter coccineus]|uniref:Putative oxidoreductase n=1 Tax=Ilumatobacter coccineus (strain NBRC 103263 / KCTC 29153 / YM16-304) TaxID=1313172 RepID=A0A6C7E1I7_ILUCY|nr:glucose 1-dehydrogenase [Ilumatobacter coccineus]BAN00790.1 putative oxidoreductase [Ilumatobacter coccineus YM16-304]